MNGREPWPHHFLASRITSVTLCFLICKLGRGHLPLSLVGRDKARQGLSKNFLLSAFLKIHLSSASLEVENLFGPPHTRGVVEGELRQPQAYCTPGSVPVWESVLLSHLVGSVCRQENRSWGWGHTRVLDRQGPQRERDGQTPGRAPAGRLGPGSPAGGRPDPVFCRGGRVPGEAPPLLSDPDFQPHTHSMVTFFFFLLLGVAFHFKGVFLFDFFNFFFFWLLLCFSFSFVSSPFLSPFCFGC